MKIAMSQGVDSIRRGNRAVHQDARMSIARHHAGVARLPLIRNMIQIEDRTHWLRPCFAAPDIEVPVDIKVLVSPDARDELSFATHIPCHFSECGARIEYTKMPLHPRDLAQGVKQFVRIEIDELRVFIVDRRALAKWREYFVLLHALSHPFKPR